MLSVRIRPAFHALVENLLPLPGEVVAARRNLQA